MPGGYLSHRGTPSSHPLVDGFSLIKLPAIEDSPFMETSISEVLGEYNFHHEELYRFRSYVALELIDQV